MDKYLSIVHVSTVTEQANKKHKIVQHTCNDSNFCC